MRMLRWMCAVTKLDKIRNERIGGTTKVGENTKKVQEIRLKWYGHVMRSSAMVMKVQGRRKRGRPKRIWLDKVKGDIKEKGLSDEWCVRPCCVERETYVIGCLSSYVDPT